MSERARFWSPAGRLARREFWGRGILLSVGFVALFLMCDDLFGHRSTLVLYPPFFWGCLVLAARRFHDRGKSVAWLLVVVVPVLGLLWLVIELGLLEGTPGENAYGPSPATLAEPPYLVVR